MKIEPRHDNSNKMICAPSEDTVQPGHPPSLIIVRSRPDHGVAGSNPAGGEILPEPKRRFIAQSLSCSPFHRLEMTEILLKGRKTLTHPSIHDHSARCPPEAKLGPKLPTERTAKTLIRLGGCPGWAQRSFCWFSHEAAHILYWC